MSLLLLIDGYNITQPIAPSRNPDPRWLERNRAGLLRELSKQLSEPIRKQTCVVFDAAAAPHGRPDRFDHQGIDVRFAVGYPSADDLIEQIIRQHHTPKRLMVVSSDHRVQIAASRRSARFIDSQPWIDDLTDGLIHLAVPLGIVSRDSRRNQSFPSGALGDAESGKTTGAGQGGLPDGRDRHDSKAAKKPRVQDSSEVADWMREFGFDE